MTLIKSKCLWLLTALLLSINIVFAQDKSERNKDSETPITNPLDHASFKFAVISDIHLKSGNVAELQSVTKDILSQDGIAFVLVLGDVADGGDLQSLKEVKQVLDKMKLPYFVVPGNHDCKNNGVGDAYFKEVFGETHFRLLCNGNLFFGINTAELRGGDAHIAPEDIDWLKKQLKNASKKTPIYLVCHHPLQSPDCDNWYQLTDVIRRRNLQAVINGHYHSNLTLNYDGIIGVVCGTMTSKPLASYALCAMTSDSLHFYNKRLGELPEQWFALSVAEKFYSEGNLKLRPNYSVNKDYKKVMESWSININGAIYNDASCVDNQIYVASHNGFVTCLSNAKGTKIWEYNTYGAILGAPIAYQQCVVVADCNKNIFCLDAQSGSLI
ncbi:MAG: metallophosphoesterase, partial [Bacteroidales bacterium]|nr:metallophosphoesterase [Bacteroidales bacterium]